MKKKILIGILTLATAFTFIITKNNPIDEQASGLNEPITTFGILGDPGTGGSGGGG